MADDIQYSSGGELVNNKRKYEVDQSPPPPRRVTGFSAPITSQSPDSAQLQPSYNSVLPIVDGVELAKQKAQEIANRIYSNVDQKRPRVENGGGFDSMEGGGNKPVAPMMTPPLQASSYNYQGSSKKIEIPNGRVGVIIGKAGETIKYLQMQSGAKIQVTRDIDADPNSGTRMVEVMGNPDQIAKAEQLIHEVINEADKGGSGVVSRRVNVQQPGADQFVMQVPNNKVGLVIGKGGESIKNMQSRSGARIQVIPLHLPPGDTSTERTVQIDGTPEQIEVAKQLVIEVTSENRSRNSGGYQQGGYQARPQSSWGGPPSMQQQPGYGYMQQPGAYPGGPSPQYNMSQPSYSQYPQQTSGGGYAAGWDQSSAPQNQAGSQGGSYDYYNQQTQPQQQQQVSGGQSGGSSDAAASYGYSQAPASGYGQQGYTHDGYGGYHVTGPQAGYEQQQQQGGYNSAPAYGNGGGGGQVDASQAPPPATLPPTNSNPNPSSYPPQVSATAAVPAQGGYGIPTSQAAGGGYGTQPGYGYGPPQGQKAVSGQSGYGQPQQSPSGGAQGGGYGQGYPPPQQQQPGGGVGYGGPAQAGYGSSYGAAQAGYGQQQPVAYNSSYGGAGSQPPPVYGGSDGTGGATPQPPPSQAVAKPSPKS